FVIDQSQQTFRISEYQIPALVTSHTTSETNRQGGWIKHRAYSFNIVRTLAGIYSRLPRPLSNESHQSFFQMQVSVPQFLVRNLSYRFSPGRGVAKPCLPILVNVILDQKTQES